MRSPLQATSSRLTPSHSRTKSAPNASPGFQTPGKAFGADFVLECEGVRREDVT